MGKLPLFRPSTRRRTIRSRCRPTLWRLLGRVVERGELKREGLGIKGDPHRYWLAALEEKWQNDPTARLEQTMLDTRRDLMQRLPELFDANDLE